MASIIFITGVSTAGKTTVFEALRKDPDLADVEFHDIDEDGIPAAGTGPWRIFRVELLLHEAAVRAREGKSTVVCGITKPHEAIESGAFPEDVPVHFVLIDVSVANVKKRLEARIGHYRPDDVQWLTQYNLRLRDLLRKSVRAQRTGIVLDPGRMSRRRLCEQVKSIVLDLDIGLRPKP
jgi:gluconate kinase